jgi:hypothetical protein
MAHSLHAGDQSGRHFGGSGGLSTVHNAMGPSLGGLLIDEARAGRGGGGS